MWVAGKTVWSPCYQAISERFRDEVHDEALYKSTFHRWQNSCCRRMYSVFRKNTHIYFAAYWNKSKTVGYLIITRKLLSKYLIQKSQSVLKMSAILSNTCLVIFLAQYEIFNFTDTDSRACTAQAITTWLSVDPSSNINFLSKVFTPLTSQCLSRNICTKD